MRRKLAAEPGRYLSIRVKRRQKGSFETALAVDQNARVLSQATQLVGFDFVLLLLGVVAGGAAVGKSPRPFDEFLLSEKVGTLDGTVLVGSFEDHPIAEIQRKHLRLFAAERRNE